MFSLVTHSCFSSTQDLVQHAIETKNYVEAERLLNQQLNTSENDLETRFLLARVLSWSGKFTEAHDQYQVLLKAEPDNSDYMLGIAQTLVWRHLPDEALPWIEKVKAVNANDPDVWRLHIQALAASNKPDGRIGANAMQEDALKLFPNQTWDIVSANSLSPESKEPMVEFERQFDQQNHNQLEIGLRYDHLTHNYDNWNAQYLDYEHWFSSRKIAYFSAETDQRYGKHDQQILAGLYFPLDTTWTMNIEGNLSPSHEVLPKNSLMLSLQHSILGGWGISGGVRNSTYNTDDSRQVFGTVERYFGKFRAAYTLRATHAAGTTEFGHQVVLSYYYNEVSYLTANLSQGKEVERELGQRLLFDTTYFGLNGRHWLNPNWAISWEAGSTSQGNAYTRTGVGLGLRRSF